VAILDWFSRYVLSFRLSNSLEPVAQIVASSFQDDTKTSPDPLIVDPGAS